MKTGRGQGHKRVKGRQEFKWQAGCRTETFTNEEWKLIQDCGDYIKAKLMSAKS